MEKISKEKNEIKTSESFQLRSDSTRSEEKAITWKKLLGIITYDKDAIFLTAEQLQSEKDYKKGLRNLTPKVFDSEEINNLFKELGTTKLLFKLGSFLAEFSYEVKSTLKVHYTVNFYKRNKKEQVKIASVTWGKLLGIITYDKDAIFCDFEKHVPELDELILTLKNTKPVLEPSWAAGQELIKSTLKAFNRKEIMDLLKNTEPIDSDLRLLEFKVGSFTALVSYEENKKRFEVSYLDKNTVLIAWVTWKRNLRYHAEATFYDFENDEQEVKELISTLQTTKPHILVKVHLKKGKE